MDDHYHRILIMVSSAVLALVFIRYNRKAPRSPANSEFPLRLSSRPARGVPRYQFDWSGLIWNVTTRISYINRNNF